MVVKIQASHPRMEGTLSYNQRKVERGVARVVGVANLPSALPGDIRRTFMRYENRNRRTDRVSFQMSINPDPAREEERLSDREVRDYTDILMRQMGFGSQPYVIYEHRDIDRTHYHVVSIRTDWEGRKIRDFKDRYLLQRLMRENAQRFHYRVGNGLPTGIVRKEQETVRPRRFDPSGGDVRKQYHSLFREAVGYRFETFSQFKAVCASFGLALDTRDTAKGTELILQGTDAKREGAAPRIGESELGEALYRRFEKRAKECRGMKPTRRTDRDRIAREVSRCLSRSRDEQSFLSLLSEKGIAATLFRTRSGEVFGATFVDATSRTAVKGSDVGITTQSYREADERWRRGETPADIVSVTRDSAAERHEEGIHGRSEDRAEDPAREEEPPAVVEEEREDAVDMALGVLSAALRAAGSEGEHLRDDGKIFRKRKRKVLKR